MKIGMLSAWNTDSGVAIHAESIGKSWIEMGHELTIFTFIKNDFHGTHITNKDENYVIRCIGTQQTNFLDPAPILSQEFDVFIIQDIMIFPMEKLIKIIPNIYRRSKIIIQIVHENQLPNNPNFYQFLWDGVIYFTERQEFLKKIYSNAQLIPFPCFPIRKRNKQDARKKLNLPQDKRIILSFCQRGYELYLRYLSDNLKDESILLILASPDKKFFEKSNMSSWMIIRQEILSHRRFDDYISASDAIVLHKFIKKDYGVVSSTAFQIIGAGCPILVPDGSDFFHLFSDEVIKYQNVNNLHQLLIELFHDKEKSQTVQQKMIQYAKKYSPEKIAVEFIKFFNELLVKSPRSSYYESD